MTDNFRLAMFVIYSILFELIVWGGFGYAVFILDHNGWWMALALVLSGCQLKPHQFGIGAKSA